LHARLRVHCAPGVSCALCFQREKALAQLGRIAPRDRTRVPVRLFENRIIKGVNRVVDDVTSKPPGRLSGSRENRVPGLRLAAPLISLSAAAFYRIIARLAVPAPSAR
jgi:hypothetical protein